MAHSHRFGRPGGQGFESVVLPSRNLVLLQSPAVITSLWWGGSCYGSLVSSGACRGPLWACTRKDCYAWLPLLQAFCLSFVHHIHVYRIYSLAPDAPRACGNNRLTRRGDVTIRGITNLLELYHCGRPLCTCEIYSFPLMI